jgi:uncharacterized protein (TIGR03066 family)
MRAFRGWLVACAAVLPVNNQAFADAKSEAENALVGKWERMSPGGLKIQIDFQKGGKLAMIITGAPMGDVKFDGTYKVIDDKTIEVTVSWMGRTGTEKSKFKITGNKLELTGENGKHTLTRVDAAKGNAKPK